MVFAHVSAEAGHPALLEHMRARPLLALDMRLGEGTGALLAWPLVRAAAAMLSDMASSESARVSGPA
jgi:nicotinate-nucleotide--dimethylbenzimidazole phosphoribosyltransferase